MYFKSFFHNLCCFDNEAGVDQVGILTKHSCVWTVWGGGW